MCVYFLSKGIAIVPQAFSNTHSTGIYHFVKNLFFNCLILLLISTFADSTSTCKHSESNGYRPLSWSRGMCLSILSLNKFIKQKWCGKRMSLYFLVFITGKIKKENCWILPFPISPYSYSSLVSTWTKAIALVVGSFLMIDYNLLCCSIKIKIILIDGISIISKDI